MIYAAASQRYFSYLLPRAEERPDDGKVLSQKLVAALIDGDAATAAAYLHSGVDANTILAYSKGYTLDAETMETYRAQLSPGVRAGGTAQVSETPSNITLLMLAVDHPSCIRMLIEAGADVNACVEPFSATALRAAVEKNAIGSLRVLLAAGAKPNQPMNMRDTVVITAIYLGNDECLRILLDARASVEYHMNNGHTPLFIAAANGNGKAVKRLLAAGASANLPCKNDQGMSPLYGAALGGHVKVARALIAGRADLHHATRDEGNAPLFVATTHGHLDVMRCLIEAGASVNHATPLGTTALHGGVFHGSARLQTVQLLLAARADTEAVERHPKGPATAIDNLTIGGFVTIRGLQSRPELNGMEAQVIGTQGDRTKLRAISGVEVAVKLHNMEVAEESSTPLIRAASGKDLELVRLLLDAGANIDFVAAQGFSAVALSVINGRTDIVELLLARGATTALPSRPHQESMMRQAKQSGFHECVQLLEAAAAKQVATLQAEAASEPNLVRESRKLCAFCGKEAEEAGVPKLQTCAGCRLVSYCCTDHQTQDWARHKQVCLQRKRHHFPDKDAILQWTLPKEVHVPARYRPYFGGDGTRQRVCNIGPAGFENGEICRPASDLMLSLGHGYAGADESQTVFFLQLELSVKYMYDCHHNNGNWLAARHAIKDLMEDWPVIEACNNRIAFFDNGCSSDLFRAAVRKAARQAGAVVQLAERRKDPGLGLLVDYPECSD